MSARRARLRGFTLVEVLIVLVLTSLITFTLIYGILAVVEVGLMLRAIKQGPPENVVDPFADRDNPDRELTVTY